MWGLLSIHILVILIDIFWQCGGNKGYSLSCLFSKRGTVLRNFNVKEGGGRDLRRDGEDLFSRAHMLAISAHRDLAARELWNNMGAGKRGSISSAIVICPIKSIFQSLSSLALSSSPPSSAHPDCIRRTCVYTCAFYQGKLSFLQPTTHYKSSTVYTHKFITYTHTHTHTQTQAHTDAHVTYEYIHTHS